MDATKAEISRLRKLRKAAEAKAQAATAGMSADQTECRRLDDLARSEALARLNGTNPAGAWHFVVETLDALQRRVAALEPTPVRNS